jgi:hypothetical protein
VVSAVGGGRSIDTIGEGCDGLLAMKLFGPLPDCRVSLCSGNVCVRLGDSGRTCDACSPARNEPGLSPRKPAGRLFGATGNAPLPKIVEGKGGIASRAGFGPPEILARDGFLVPLAVDGLVIVSGLLPIVPLLFLLLVLATDRARECLNEEGLGGRDWL